MNAAKLKLGVETVLNGLEAQLTSFDVECPCLGDFDLGLSSPVATSTMLSSVRSGVISSSFLGIRCTGQKSVGDRLRSSLRSSLNLPC